MQNLILINTIIKRHVFLRVPRFVFIFTTFISAAHPQTCPWYKDPRDPLDLKENPRPKPLPGGKRRNKPWDIQCSDTMIIVDTCDILQSRLHISPCSLLIHNELRSCDINNIKVNTAYPTTGDLDALANTWSKDSSRGQQDRAWPSTPQTRGVEFLCVHTHCHFGESTNSRVVPYLMQGYGFR